MSDEQPSGVGLSGIQRLCRALRNSVRGLGAAARFEPAFRQELFLAIILIPVALILNVSGVEKMLMISSILLVLLVEVLNSAIENVVDRIGPEHHKLSGRAKDQASAAVLLAILIAIVVWAFALIGIIRN